jgi:hypothetical protein
MREMRNGYRSWLENLKVGYLLEDLGVGGRIVLKWVIHTYDMRVWTGFILFRIGSCEHGNEPSNSVKIWELLD